MKKLPLNSEYIGNAVFFSYSSVLVIAKISEK